jgi:hypothetical protein
VLCRRRGDSKWMTIVRFPMSPPAQPAVPEPVAASVPEPVPTEAPWRPAHA